MEPHASLAVWEDGDLLALRLDPGHLRRAPHARRGVRARPQAGARDRPARRRRLRLQGHAAAAGGARRDRGPRWSSAPSSARQAAADVRAASATARRRSSASASAPTRTAGSPRSPTTRSSRPRPCASSPSRPHAHAHDVRGARPPDAPPARRARRPDPSWMRAPGECPGMFALESAIDELATAAGLDPIELRIRNEPERRSREGHPVLARATSSAACARAPSASAGPTASRAPTAAG